MDSKTRSVFRAVFTKEANQLRKLLSKDPVESEIRARLHTLTNRYAKLQAADEEISGRLILSTDEKANEQLEEELIKSSEYEYVYSLLREQVTMALESLHLVDVESVAKTALAENCGNSQLLKIKRPEIRKFIGEVRGWISFWASFSSIHDDVKLKEEDKFALLLNALVPGSPAQRLVEGFPPSKENYVKAVELLKSRYGKAEFLIEYYVRELLGLVLRRNETTNIADLHDKLASQLRALDSLGVTKEKYAAMIFPLVESAIPESTFKVWERHRIGKGASIKDPEGCLTELLDFLKIEVEGEERLKLRQTTFEDPDSNSPQKQKPARTASAASLVSTELKQRETLICIFCDKSHYSHECGKAVDMTLTERTEIVKKKGACFKCLKRNHISAKCRAFLKCAVCKGKHYPVMCRGSLMPQGNTKPNEGTVESKALLIGSLIPIVYLQTLKALVVSDGQEHHVRILIDSGSQKSYILKSCVQKFKLKRQNRLLIRQELFGGQKTAVKSHSVNSVLLKSLNGSFECEFNLLDQEQICGFVPKISDMNLYNSLKEKGIILTDFDNNADSHLQDIQILLGADAWPLIITDRIMKLEPDLVAINTKLGWSVIGSSKEIEPASISSAMVVTLSCLSHLSNFWELELLGIKDPGDKKTQQERDAEVQQFFYNTVRRDDTGRYIVRLPWTNNQPAVRDNLEIARRRLTITTKRLKLMGKFEQYDQIFQDWLRQGIIERVPDGEMCKICHYLPHRAVLKENSTTQVRPVFDASNQDEDGHSLNGCVEQGPNEIELIILVLTQFRQYPIGVTSDIEKAFLQIALDPGDRDWLRFLWWEDGKVFVLRHCRVVFGVSSSPYLLAAVLNHHLRGAAPVFKDTAEKLRQSFYVDNCLTGVENTEELHKFRYESEQLMSSAGFNLRGWTSNLENPDSEVNVLGLLWDCGADTLGCYPKMLREVPTSFSRRSLLSMAQRIYDPIGFTAPVGLIPKLLLQKCWDKKRGWDDPLPEEVTMEFSRWLNQINLLAECRIPRRIYVNTTSVAHVFCDASKVAYATCVFLRTEYNGCVKVDMLMAKARVAPLQSLTIPRLELMAAIMGVRVFSLAVEAVNRIVDRVIFWSDSVVVIAWIKGKQQWSVFVENRVKEIRESSSSDQWRHVPGVDNPADLLSRGCSPSQLAESKWWEGPLWLQRPEEQWPNSRAQPEMEQVQQERRKTVITAEATVAVPFSLSSLAERFSSYVKIIRTLVRCLDAICILCPGFMKHCGLTEDMVNNQDVTSEKCINAETIMFRTMQQESFAGDLETKLKNLSVYTDQRGVLRLKSRLLEGEDTPEFVYPILLPSKHPITIRLIRHEHVKNDHAGTLTLIVILRERFWVPQCRRAVNAVVRRCVTCRKQLAKSLQVPIPPLPRDRTRSCQTFHTTGVDLAGPLFLASGEKCWVVLFTCAVYRAVHLDLVMSLSSTALIKALRRFVARRGRPQVIQSDNGTNFVGLENSLSQLDWAELEKECSVQRIRWKFNPPSAPWWGGYWERLVRILKDLLRKNLGNASVSYEELVTLLCECEAIMNGRPLTYVSEESGDLRPLTHAMFLSSLPNSEVDDLDIVETTSLESRWRYLQSVRQGLRSRFRKEYLGFLRSSKKKRHDVIKTGDIVIVGSDKKRLEWQLARVIELMPGRDDVTRLARLKVQSGEILRPLQRLFPLEISSVTTTNGHVDSPEEEEDTNPGANSPETEAPTLDQDDGIQSDDLIDDGTPTTTRSGRVVKKREVLDL